MKKILTLLIILAFLDGFAQSTILGANAIGASATTTQGAAPIIEPPPPPPNAITFTYDNAGNQIQRVFIYISTTLLRKNNNPITPKDSEAVSTKFLQSDLYEEISYYPNPVKSELYLNWKENDSKDMQTIQLFDMNGRMLKSFINQSNFDTATIDFESYPAGYYVLYLLYNDATSKDLRIIKK